MYSVALTMTYLAAQSENKKLEDLSQNDFACVPKNILSLSESHYLRILQIESYATVCFCNDSTHFFHLEPYCQCT